MTHQYQNGFVLLTVLVLLQIFSLMGLYGLTQASLALQRENVRWQREEYARLSGQILGRIETGHVIDSGSCRILVTPVSKLAEKPESWWEINTCSDNFSGIRYYYAIESMGSDSCGIVGLEAGKHLLIAHYYRISLLIIPHDKKAEAALLLQSAVIRPGKPVDSCDHSPHIVYTGRQMRREIYLQLV
jgi:hypothetical protein